MTISGESNGSGRKPFHTAVPDARRAALVDALQHVMADVLSLTVVTSFAAWNALDEEAARSFREHVAEGRHAQDEVAACFRDLDSVVALHPSDPSEVPRWMLAVQSTDPIERAVTLAAAIEELIRSLDACVEVASDAEASGTTRAMKALSRRYAKSLTKLTGQIDRAMGTKVKGASKH